MKDKTNDKAIDKNIDKTIDKNKNKEQLTNEKEKEANELNDEINQIDNQISDLSINLVSNDNTLEIRDNQKNNQKLKELEKSEDNDTDNKLVKSEPQKKVQVRTNEIKHTKIVEIKVNSFEKEVKESTVKNLKSDAKNEVKNSKTINKNAGKNYAKNKEPSKTVVKTTKTQQPVKTDKEKKSLVARESRSNDKKQRLDPNSKAKEESSKRSLSHSPLRPTDQFKQATRTNKTNNLAVSKTKQLTKSVTGLNDLKATSANIPIKGLVSQKNNSKIKK